jgi:hypothetical protein
MRQKTGKKAFILFAILAAALALFYAAFRECQAGTSPQGGRHGHEGPGEHDHH